MMKYLAVASITVALLGLAVMWASQDAVALAPQSQLFPYEAPLAIKQTPAGLSGFILNVDAPQAVILKCQFPVQVVLTSCKTRPDGTWDVKAADLHDHWEASSAWGYWELVTLSTFPREAMTDTRMTVIQADDDNGNPIDLNGFQVGVQWCQ